MPVRSLQGLLELVVITGTVAGCIIAQPKGSGKVAVNTAFGTTPVESEQGRVVPRVPNQSPTNPLPR